MKKLQPVRGTRDVLEEEFKDFQAHLMIWNALTMHYGFNMVDTPILEDSEVFKKTLGVTSDIIKKDIFIKNGKIAQISSELNIECDNIIDATNLHVIPGAIDPQVHFREPGLTHKEDIESGAKSAVAGGITTFFEMPNTNPATITSELLNQKFDIASKTSVANYSFFLGATPYNFSEIANMQDNCGLKIFMGSSTGDLLVDSDAALDEIFKQCNKVIAIHSEDEAILR